MAIDINRTLVAKKEYVRPGERGFTRVEPDLAHDHYTYQYECMGERRTVNLAVRRTGRTDGSDLQIEVRIDVFRDNKGKGKRDFMRTECGSFCLPAHIAADFIKSCTEIV
jgi:hypothetical protein